MTLVRLHDIRENDVNPDAGMSNIPWEYEYGFQKHTDELDDQFSTLEGLFWYESSSSDDSILDGLSPDAPVYIGSEKVEDGNFFTTITVKTKSGTLVSRNVSREYLIEAANALLRKAASPMAIAIQHEYILPGPDSIMQYEFCREASVVPALIIDDVVFPLRQLLDLRGFPVVGKIEWVEPDEC